MIEAEGLSKRYGATLALDRVGLAVPAGSVVGLLGPNGAGKTTMVRILTTLARADEGWARVAGYDVAAQAEQVRRRIGVAAQDATVDELLTGRQNLLMVGELSGLRRRQARDRAGELLDEFELTEAADRVVKGYSGGMRRRLDLAAALIAHPPVLFLDEPTTGLDPVARARVWQQVREMTGGGVTVLLTTQYLDEADHLADQILVIDHGRVIAAGTPTELKRATGTARLEVALSEPHPAAATAVASFLDGSLHTSSDGRRLRGPVRRRAGLVPQVVRALDAAGVAADEVAIHQPSLDDVFFALTGHAAVDLDTAQSEQIPA
jgi:ABC-2 type transport system ATP-binding protein